MPPLSRRQPRQRGREERGPGYPLFSCREVPMNFATLNKKWFHEVNISVTIPSPTRGAHARIARRQRRAGSDGRTDGRAYIHTHTYTFTYGNTRRRVRYAYGRIYSLALARPRARARSFPLALLLSFSRTEPLFGVHHGATHAHARIRTRSC